MAQARIDITCTSCGTGFTHKKICYNRKQADSYEEWARENITVCPDCYKEICRKAEKKAQKKALISDVMKRAWRIYRELEGDHVAKLKMALLQAWKEVKSTASELSGTAKQIAWANDIKTELISAIKEVGMQGHSKEYVNTFIQNVIENSLTNAKWWIENRVDLLHGENGIFEIDRKATREHKSYNQIYAAFLNRLIIEAKKQNPNFPNKK